MTTKRATAREADPDVALVAALIAHASPRGNAPQAKAAAAVRPGAGATARAATPRVARLSVEHRVQRCRALASPGDERACVREACTRHWGHHAECPQRLMARQQVVARSEL